MEKAWHLKGKERHIKEDSKRDWERILRYRKNSIRKETFKSPFLRKKHWENISDRRPVKH